MNYNHQQIDRIEQAWEELYPQFETPMARDWGDNQIGWYVRCKVCESTVGFLSISIQMIQGYHSYRVSLMNRRMVPHLRTQDHQQNAMLARLAGPAERK